VNSRAATGRFKVFTSSRTTEHLQESLLQSEKFVPSVALELEKAAIGFQIVRYN
jgi:hypothetical protein